MYRSPENRKCFWRTKRLRSTSCKGSSPNKSNAFYTRDGPPRIKPTWMIPQKSFGRLPFPCPLTMGASSTDYELWSRPNFEVASSPCYTKGTLVFNTWISWLVPLFIGPTLTRTLLISVVSAPRAIHQNAPPKAALHPWMLPEKPRSRLHLDHAINFMGHNWLVMVDAYSEVPLYPSNPVDITKDHDEAFGAGFCPFRLPTYFGYV